MRSRIVHVSRSAEFLVAIRPRIPHALLLGLIVALMDTLRAFPMLTGDGPEGGWVPMLVELAIANTIGAGIMIGAITWAERARVPASFRFPVMGATVLASAVLATIVRAALAWMFQSEPQALDPREWTALGLYMFWMSCATGALAAFYYEFWERAAHSTTRLRSAELERQGIEQRVVESRLSVMKARIEPAFLFSSIATVQKLYRANTDAAEKLLDDLIVYLRAALPQMRGRTSSLGDEIHLVASYLKLHDDAFGGRLRVTFDVPEAARELQFPPMVLLPLVEDAVQRARGMSRPALSLEVFIFVAEKVLRVAVEDDCPLTRVDPGSEPALTAQQHSLAAFFGDAARLTRGAGANGGTRVTFEIPRAHDPRDHR